MIGTPLDWAAEGGSRTSETDENKPLMIAVRLVFRRPHSYASAARFAGRSVERRFVFVVPSWLTSLPDLPISL